MLVQLDPARSPGLEARGAHDRAVPVRRPDAVGVTRPGPPGQHPVGEVDPEPLAQPAQVRLGVAEEVAGVDDRRLLGQRIEQPNLLEQPDVLGLARLPRPDVGRDDLGGVADQQDVAKSRDPVERPVPKNVVGHVLGVVHRCLDIARQLADHLVGIGGLGSQHLGATRMVEPGLLEVRRIERLVDDHRVRPVLPRPHHRGRDVARPRPHRHPDRHAGVLRLTSSATCCW